jgi:hypothetical protein
VCPLAPIRIALKRRKDLVRVRREKNKNVETAILCIAREAHSLILAVLARENGINGAL